jgi:hypothetical protein
MRSEWTMLSNQQIADKVRTIVTVARETAHLDHRGRKMKPEDVVDCVLGMMDDLCSAIEGQQILIDFALAALPADVRVRMWHKECFAANGRDRELVRQLTSGFANTADMTFVYGSSKIATACEECMRSILIGTLAVEGTPRKKES